MKKNCIGAGSVYPFLKFLVEQFLFKRIIPFILFIIVSLPLKAQWVNITGPDIGNINSLAVSGTDIFAAADFRGLFYSNDLGTHWNIIDSRSEAGSIRDIVINGKNIFAGFFGGILIYRNNGTQWIADTSTAVTGYFSDFAFNGVNLFAATSDPFGENKGGLFRSNDNGESWTKVYPNAVSAVTFSGKYLLATVYGTLLRSSDKGDHWTTVPTSIVNLALAFFNIAEKTYVLTGSDSVFVSTNDGETWTPAMAAPFRRGTSLLEVPKINSSSEYFVGNSSGIFLSTDEGTTWNQVNSGLNNMNVKSLALLSGEEPGEIIIAGTTDGIYESTDRGISWIQPNSGIARYSNLSLFSEGSKLYAGSDKGGAYFSEDNGLNWNKIAIGPANYSVTCFIKDETDIFAGTKGSGIFASTDSGTSWNTRNSGLTNYNITSLAVNDSYLFAGTYNGGIFRSSNNGTNWENINSGLEDIYISSLAVSGMNLFFGELFDGVYRSTNNGANWVKVNSGLSDTRIASLKSDGINLFTGTRGGYVFRSTDNGSNWTVYNSRLTNLSVNSLLLNKKDLFVGSDVGVFLITNNGNESFFTDSAKLRGVNSLAVNDSYIFAGTLEGIWRRSLSEFTKIENTVAHTPLNFRLEQNYPNPFNPVTNFEFQIGEFPAGASGIVSLKIYNVLGKEIAALINEEKTAGIYKINWNAHSLPSGVYFYQLKAGNFLKTKKLLLLK